ncbi:hypothetical protein FHP88_15780 [Sedimenticola selenatireducens]|uniref:Uncharacterized protein n=1 Tax=Sedimenticola selenatireducens TaxID=191960 RepID=A0A557S0G0_9GAMM|nr:hypothetical protein [Sedimenticola selenatireducens]TVO70913.1 hypothetical protein FHP88_15780 [Sedimenticola selenatireducens]
MRTSDPTTQAALDQDNIPLVIFVELDFASATSRVHSGVGNLQWNGHTWMGAGAVGEISEIQEGDELQSNDIQMVLNGVDPAMMATAMSEDYQGRPAKIWLGILDNDHQMLGEPIGPFGGLMDTMDGEIGKEGRIVLTVKNRLADWERPRIRRYTNEDQQAEFPGDLGMEFVSQMVEKELVW